MNKETYKRLYMDVTLFEAEDVITTSDEEYEPDPFEMTGTGTTNSNNVFPGT